MIYILILIFILELIGLVLIIKSKNSKMIRFGNVIFLTLVFSLLYFENIFRCNLPMNMWNLIITYIYLIVIFVGFMLVFRYLIGVYLYTIVNILCLLGSTIKYDKTGKLVSWSDFKGGLFLNVVWDMFLKDQYIYVIIVVVMINIFGFYLLKKIQPAYLSNRILFFLTDICILVLLTLIVSSSYSKSDEIEVKEERGGVLYFIGSKNSEIMEMPRGYSRKRIEGLVEKYTKKFEEDTSSKIDDSGEIVIEILSESLVDPMSFSKTIWASDPMPTIRNLQNKNGGFLYTPVFGGGTANVEFSLLTGFNYSFLNNQVNGYDYLNEYPERSIGIPNYKEQSIAMHTHLGKGYNRDKVIPNLGFSSFITREDMIKNSNEVPVYFQEGYISDDTFFSQLTKIVQENNNKNLFVHSLSMQNHYPYTENFKGELKKSEIMLGDDNDSDNTRQLALYARGVKETDNSVRSFLAQLDKDSKNITVVFYGDHYPALDDNIYKNFPVENKYKTPYFIWKNKNRETQFVNKSKETPAGLGLRILEESGNNLSIFHKFLKYFEEEVDNESILNNSELLNGKQKELVEEYKLLQYDMLCGSRYSKSIFQVIDE